MLIINYHHLLWTEIRTLFCKSPVACGCGCSLPCFPDLLLVLRLCSLWRDHWVRWSSMEKTVCVLSWLKLEALSCSRNNRGSPSFRTAMISSFTYRTQTEALFRAFHWQYYCFFTKLYREKLHGPFPIKNQWHVLFYRVWICTSRCSSWVHPIST